MKSGGYSLVAVHGFLFAVASLLVEHGLQGTWASGVVIVCCLSNVPYWPNDYFEIKIIEKKHTQASPLSTRKSKTVLVLNHPGVKSRCLLAQRWSHKNLCSKYF